MRHILQLSKKLSAVFAVLVLLTLPGLGWGQTTYTFSSKSWAASPTNWTSIKDGLAFIANQGIQVSTGVSGACGNSPISFSNVTSVTVGYCTNASAGVGTINVFSVANASAPAQSGTRIGSSTSVSTIGGTTVRYITFNATTAISGNIQIFVTCTTNSIFIRSVEIINASNDQTSIVEAPTTQISASDIASTATSSGAAVDAFKFKITDLGTADVLATKVTAVKIKKSSGSADWTDHIAGASLWDGASQITTGTAVITDTDITIPITSGNLDVANAGNKEITMKIWLKTVNIVDNSTMVFNVSQTGHGFTSDASGSGFAADFGAALTGNTITVRVAATKLLFVQQPTSTQKDVAMAPSPSVNAVDANNNTDLDYSTTVSVTSSGTLAGSPVSGGWASNVFTFSPLTHTASGTGLVLTAASGSITNAVSNTFDVTDPQPEINIQENSTNYLTASTFAFGNVVSGNSSSVKTFTIQNTGAADLTLTGVPKVAISGTNLTEFTIDQSSIASTVAASGTTTFTITFSPTSQGSKTAQISIANNDVTGSENPYIINLTGTGTVSTASDITVKSGFTYPSNIAYATYQATDISGGANDIEIAQFTIRDGGATVDADNLVTTLNQIVFTVTNPSNVRRIALYDGAAEVGTEQAAAAMVTFSGLSLTAADGGTKDFSVRISYNSTVTDNQQTQLTVTATTSAAITGSGFAATNAGAAATSISGNDNKLEVTATQLIFTQQPTTTGINVAMAPAVIIAARDANNNTDLDFTDNIRVSSSGTMTDEPVSLTASSGVATFSNLTHTVIGTGLMLTAERDNTGAWDWDVTSSSFNIDSFIGKRWDRGAATNNWSDAANWYPDGIPSASDNVLLNNDFVSGTYSVLIDGTTTRIAKTLQVGYDGNTNSITLQITGGSSSVDAFNIGNGTGDDLIITDGGIVDNSSVVGSTGNRGIEFTSSSSTWIMTGTGMYIHNQNGGSFPNATSGEIAAPTFSNNSTFVVKNITNWINAAGLGKNKNYGNLVFDGLSVTATLTNSGGLADGTVLKVNGSMQVINGSSVRLLNNTSMTTGVTIDITGSLTVDNGSYLICSGGSGTGAIISVGGSTTTTGTGYIAASQASTPASGLNTYILKGDFNGYYNSSSKFEILSDCLNFEV